MKNKKIVKVLPFVLVAIALIGFISYALLTIDLEGMKISGVTRPNVSISLDEAKSIDLTLSEMSDANGKTQTNYSEFTVSSKGKWDGTIPVNVYMKEINKGIDNSNIKVYLTKVSGGTETQVLAPTAVSSLALYPEDTNSYILNKGSYAFTNTEEKTYTDTYRLRVWVKEGATIAAPGYTTTNESDGSISATTNDIKYSFKINVSTKEVGPLMFSDYLIKSNGLWKTNLDSDGYRYVGANPNNFVCFGTTDKRECINNPTMFMYRIIGVFPDASGVDHVKLIKYANFDFSNAMGGDLLLALNGSDFLTNTTYPYMQNATWSNKIESWPWRFLYDDAYWQGSSVSTEYLYELNKAPSSFNVGSTVWETYNGKIGYLYPSDYFLASGEGMLNSTISSSYSTFKGSWIHYANNANTSTYLNEYTAWYNESTGAPMAIGYSSNGDIQLIMAMDGEIGHIRPCFYLINDIQRDSGTGALSDPYILTVS